MPKAEKQPWIKFYPTDWRGDPKLRACCLAARGLWMECIGVMHEAVPYGHLLLNGQPVTDVQLAAMAGADASTVSSLMAELETAGVLSRTRDGTIYSRRMTRDAKKAAIARKNGKSGGNPSLGKDAENPPSDNPRVKPPDKPQKPETRYFQESLDRRAESQVPREAPAHRGAARATALPDGWEPSPTVVHELRRGRPDLTDSDIARETKAFCLRQLEAAATSFNFDAAWHRWMLRARHEEISHGQRGGNDTRATAAERERREGIAAGIASLHAGGDSGDG